MTVSLRDLTCLEQRCRCCGDDLWFWYWGERRVSGGFYTERSAWNARFNAESMAKSLQRADQLKRLRQSKQQA